MAYYKYGNHSMEVFWVNLDHTIGSKTQKTRPALIISNDLQNRLNQRFIIAPITLSIKKSILSKC
jgi:mRNA interferase MazF